MEYELSDGDIKAIAGAGTKIMTYPQIMQHDTLESMFGKANKVVILYLNEQNGNSYQGHWCLITRHNGNVVFFDSYGLMPDEQLKFHSKSRQRELGQTHNHLTRLLAESPLPVEYNEMKFQKKIRGVNTCGRHVGLRAKFYQVPLVTYQKLFKNLAKSGINLDMASVELTDPIISRLII